MAQFPTQQVSALVNNMIKQVIGTEAFQQVSSQGIVAMGDLVLGDGKNTEAWMNSLPLRIGKTILVQRYYENELNDLELDDYTWGAIMQKIRVMAPDFIEDPSWTLTDGQTVDQYVVHKPTVLQKFYYARTPYVLPLSRPIYQLEDAFLSYEAMARFLSTVQTEVKNKLELGIESLARICIINFIAECQKTPGRVINLVGDYMAETGKTGVTAQNAYFDPDFLRYASTIMRYTSGLLQSMSYKYGDGTAMNFTPPRDQRMKVIRRFNMALQSEVEYNAFHRDLIALRNFKELNFWQNINNPTSIKVERASDGTSVELDNIVGLLYDRNALGTYRRSRRTLTTPVNALGAYYNTYWHMWQLWFNDMSENGVVFTLSTDPSPASDLTRELSMIRSRDQSAKAINQLIPKPPVRTEETKAEETKAEETKAEETKAEEK